MHVWCEVRNNTNPEGKVIDMNNLNSTSVCSKALVALLFLVTFTGCSTMSKDSSDAIDEASSPKTKYIVVYKSNGDLVEISEGGSVYWFKELVDPSSSVSL